MANFVATLLDNVVFLIVLLPIAGAGLVLAASRIDHEAVRRTAATNVVVTCLLVLLMVGHFDIEAIDTSSSETAAADIAEMLQMETSIRWLGAGEDWSVKSGDRQAGWAGLSAESQPLGPRSSVLHPQFSAHASVRFAVGVDGISLWLIAATVVLTLAGVVATWETRPANPGGFYAAILLAEASLLGAFAAADVLLFCFFLELGTLPLSFLVGRWGRTERRAAAKRFLRAHLAGSLLILLGMISLVLAYARLRATDSDRRPALNFSIPALAAEIPLLAEKDEATEVYWYQASPWIFLVLAVGFAIKAALFPLHRWFCLAAFESPAVGNVLLAGACLPLGCYGFARFVVPLFTDILFEVGEIVVGLSVAGAGFVVLTALAQEDLRDRVSRVCLGQFGICVAGIVTCDLAGMAGGLLHLLSCSLSAGMLLLLMGVLERRGEGETGRRVEGEKEDGSRRAPYTIGFYCVAAFSLAGVPGLSGFPGELMVLLGIYRGDVLNSGFGPALAFWLLVVLLLSAWILLSAIPAVGRLSRTRLLSSGEMLSLAPLGILSVAIGLWPQFFVDRLQPSVAAILSVYSR